MTVETQRQPEHNSLKKQARRPKVIGAVILVGFFGSLLLWSIFAPLSGAVIASGSIAPEGSTRVVQHLEGGIVDEILVKEGDHVSRGTPLVRLRDVRARTQYEILKTQAFLLSVIEGRLRAEQRGEAEWSPLLSSEGNAELQKILRDQKTLFDLRRRGLQEEVELLAHRIKDLETSNSALAAQNEAAERQRSILVREISMVEGLHKQGLEALPRLYYLQRTEAAITETMLGRQGSMARASVQIQSLRTQMQNLRTRYESDVEASLESNVSHQIEVSRKLREAEDVLLRTIIFAPIDGIVTQVRHQTVGAVLQPGDPVLHLVPNKESLVVEARIRPIDIENVSANQSAQVRSLASNYRSTDPIDATIETVSADLFIDPRNGEHYYLARLLLSQQSGERWEDTSQAVRNQPRLTAGMPVEVTITTRPHSIIQYILTPLSSAFRRSFRES